MEVPRVSSLYPMASAGTEEWGCARARLPAAAEGGNPGEYSSESPEGVEIRQEDPRMPKTAAITNGGWERRRRSPDWRMRSPSEEGRDNTTLLERGPLGSGGTSHVKGPHTEAGSLADERASRRREQT